MSTTSLLAGEVMDRSAALLNDPAKTDYTYVAQLPYLNMAIDELLEVLEESQASPTIISSAVILLEVGQNRLTPIESTVLPHYPEGLVEIQEIGERAAGSTGPTTRMTRLEFHPTGVFPPQNTLGFWHWEAQFVIFNPTGALRPIELQLKYIHKGIGALPVDETSPIPLINSRSYLSYKTAALCAQFIGENETRAGILQGEAEKALERIIGVTNNGRQQIMTRHRPFRAAYKARGGY